ncbi:MAG: quinol dehydrogenase ferredoxin subunit NapH [Alphaproteobacteria bacterium]|nr:quinol dehydrogenase ferredoxin subunit NapH [Alphaproteobacteria bacterium]
MTALVQRSPGAEAVQRRGRVAAFKWLTLRRLGQVFFLLLFLTGPWFGFWIAKGTLASSLTFGVLPLTDPLVALQSLLAGHVLETNAALGAVLVILGYLLAGGRSYCSWVCPINPVTDFAHWLRGKLGIGRSATLSRQLRWWLLAGVLFASAATGTIAWEYLNPVTLFHRALVFGTALAGFAWVAVLFIFLLDLVVAERGWCGHLCPVGAFYGALGQLAVLRVDAVRRAACDNCLDCYKVCPEPQVLTPALRGAGQGVGSLVLDRDCTNCGRCIDVCHADVFEFATRFRKDRSAVSRLGEPSPVPRAL